MSAMVKRRHAKRLRLFSFWVEHEDDCLTPWLKRAWSRSSSKKKAKSDVDEFLKEIEKSGVRSEGICMWNCEVSGGNDISLMYPAIHINSLNQDIHDWLGKEADRQDVEEDIPTKENLLPEEGERRRLIQGTYRIVESLYPSQEISSSAEQLTVLLGFRTTDDNCVDTEEADEERSEEARSWREWTGIGTLYQKLNMLDEVEVFRVDFMESHIPDHSAVFHYIVLLSLQVGDSQSLISVLDTVARFRVRNMSGYVTVYKSVNEDTADSASIKSSLGEALKKIADDKTEAKKKFLKS